MKRLSIVATCLLFCGCASQTELIRREADRSDYLDRDALGAVMLGLQSLKYPLTRAETLSQLHLLNRELPSLVTIVSDGETTPAMHTGEFERLCLTDPERSGLRYTLVLWYDRRARELGGDAFVDAKIIDYVELLVEDDGSAGTPKAIYLLQSNRYPYVNLEFPHPSPIQK